MAEADFKKKKLLLSESENRWRKNKYYSQVTSNIWNNTGHFKKTKGEALPKLTHRAFASAVDRPIKRIERSVCEEMYLILETITWKHECFIMLNMKKYFQIYKENLCCSSSKIE